VAEGITRGLYVEVATEILNNSFETIQIANYACNSSILHFLILQTSIMASLMGQFVENAKYMPQEGDKEVSACQLECKEQQTAVVACVDSIREEGKTSACLAPAVQAWTKCCTEANVAEKDD
jgi:hypothetical protein